MSKFHPDDLKNPLYEQSQVVTAQDLKVIYYGLIIQYRDSKWWEFRIRYNALIAKHVIYELLLWLQDGKSQLKDIGDLK